MNDSLQDYNQVDVLIVGAGPAGLAAAIAAKHRRPELTVVVIDKGAAPGSHALSGAVLEPGALVRLLDPVLPGWPESDEAKGVLLAQVEVDDVLWLPGHRQAWSLRLLLKAARLLGLGYGQMLHAGDYICSVSRLASWLGKVAREMGVEVLPGFAAADLLWDEAAGRAAGVRLVDQGRDREGQPQRNFLPGETIRADFILLAEGCDGLLSEKFIAKAGLQRAGEQLYSLGVKELIRVSDQQYAKFGMHRVVHAMGFPLWTPLSGPDVFGGGIMYPMGDNRIAVGIIAGLDYHYHDFNPQNALALFKEHHYVRQFIEGGTLVEAGAKMIPEGGWDAVPRCPESGSIGKGNVILLGDAAGLVNMLKIKGLHNAIESGLAAAAAMASALETPEQLAAAYTAELSRAGVEREMAAARNFRQCIARFGTTAGLLLAAGGRLLPRFKVGPDYTRMTNEAFPRRVPTPYDKDTFTALTRTGHREEEPCHLLIGDEALCRDRCLASFGGPCVTFCPAGVYEKIGGLPRPANPSNCLHCKTCQRKCPYDNIRWMVPEGGEGPNYSTM
ncbi:electron transfer flavoprotein-ubiquinone oxidoreductase [Desulfurivibrio dismutans]|uniref:electron transfer flavoprotein-ubiquinone oxidoreductase n=1 Tax=Desulfurivibrio dismutans TaxID=1398908 RepID=UPI0023DBBD93|nr:electron-transfer flavoprotein:ubiquinone oxidoreductase [Desulfurivibrio alkaliphilus]MDF1614429.1 electron-transfer flavoprotein:ubiquinone oxidoreductase [Desulfurivibrio alkaliphilus]